MASSSCSELENTLPNGAWKDSFDKLLDVKPLLRQLNVLKKDVRASFNNDSSVENSKDISGLLAVPKVVKRKAIPTKVSTPARKALRHPFKCPISPITTWKFQLLNDNKKKKQTPPVSLRPLQSTVINPDIIVIDYDDEKERTKDAIQCVTEKEKTFGMLFEPKGMKKFLGKRQVLFDSNVNRKSEPSSKEKSDKPPPKVTAIRQRKSKARSSHGKFKRKSPTDVQIHPGKWRKSLSYLRRSQLTQAQVRRSSQRNIDRLEVIEDDGDDESVEFINVIPACNFIGNRKTMLIKPEIENNEESLICIDDFKEKILECCRQKEPVCFNEIFNVELMSDCFKIGEGVYGEVFLKKIQQESIVCKIIPIEGTDKINGEIQKTYEQILPEIVISKELCNLRNGNTNNATCGFVEMKKVALVKGKYPEHLVKLWEAYDERKDSENDHPEVFPETQLYVILDLEFAGNDMETFIFNNAEQSFAALKQIVLSLAIAEEELEFEHRDLHWGNVLIRPIVDTELTYKLCGKSLTLPTMGIKVTIIDYTLSRMKHKNHCFYNDLSSDEELFTATGDYQFDIYRMMRDLLGRNWERFEPKTNIYWISYIISKMTNGVKYKNTRSKGHTQILRKMRALRNEVLEYNSACDLVKHLLNI